MTEWIWLKTVNMTKKVTTMNVNMVNMTKNIINITTKTNVKGRVWPKIKNIVNITTTTRVNEWVWLKIKRVHYGTINYMPQAGFNPPREKWQLCLNIVVALPPKLDSYQALLCPKFYNVIPILITSRIILKKRVRPGFSKIIGKDLTEWDF